mmetsp:Transcript_113043/g.319859  ORF Transcript_113043/g.319859 Transcript_113043/m.319859 type:complete len:217 (-) Transcript_113043:304-954(-)
MRLCGPTRRLRRACLHGIVPTAALDLRSQHDDVAQLPEHTLLTALRVSLHQLALTLSALSQSTLLVVRRGSTRRARSFVAVAFVRAWLAAVASIPLLMPPLRHTFHTAPYLMLPRFFRLTKGSPCSSPKCQLLVLVCLVLQRWTGIDCIGKARMRSATMTSRADGRTKAHGMAQSSQADGRTITTNMNSLETKASCYTKKKIVKIRTTHASIRSWR